jgi:hypothetical protein
MKDEWWYKKSVLRAFDHFNELYTSERSHCVSLITGTIYQNHQYKLQKSPWWFVYHIAMWWKNNRDNCTESYGRVCWIDGMISLIYAVESRRSVGCWVLVVGCWVLARRETCFFAQHHMLHDSSSRNAVVRIPQRDVFFRLPACQGVAPFMERRLEVELTKAIDEGWHDEKSSHTSTSSRLHFITPWRAAWHPVCLFAFQLNPWTDNCWTRKNRSSSNQPLENLSERRFFLKVEPLNRKQLN